MAELRQISNGQMTISRAPRTLEAYAAAWSVFRAWCADAGLHHLPCSEDTLLLYITSMLFKKTYKIATAEHHISAIRHYHRGARLAVPPDAQLRMLLSNVRRERKELPDKKTALDVQDLVRVAEACNTTTPIGLRDRAIVVLGFASSLRRSNLSRLQLADISFRKEGLALAISRSKTDQMGKGQMFAVWAGERESTDPVRVVRAWLEVRGDWPGPLFCRIYQSKIKHLGISGESIHESLQRAIARVGLDPSKYGAHSMRAGAVTAAADLGRTDQEIMVMSGHKSQKVMQGYVRSARLFSGRNPLAGAM